jgi:hypothetical protein
VDLVPALSSITVSGGRLNVNNALRDCTSPVSVSPGSVAFGIQVVNSASAAKTLTLTNRQAIALSFSGITVEGDFAQSNDCGQYLAAHSQCSITVTFNPTGVGYASGSLTIRHDAENSPQTVHLSGSAVLAVTVFPQSITFAGVVPGGSSSAQYVRLTNNQSSALAIYGVSISGAFNQTTTCGASVGPAQSCNVLVTFTPTAMGTQTGELVISHGAPNSPYIISLTGTGVSPVMLSPAVLDFGGIVVGTSSLKRTASLMNRQKNASLNIGGIVAGGDFTQTNNCPSLLGPSLTCYINVIFKPAAIGARNGTVAIAGNTPESPYILRLSGAGLGQPDLVATSIAVPAPIVIGQAAQVTDTTQNQGLASAAGSTTRYYLSTIISTVTAGILLAGSRTVPALAPGASSTGTATVTISPYTPAGSFYVLACADGGKSVAESNESNNCKASGPVAVKTP